MKKLWKIEKELYMAKLLTNLMGTEASTTRLHMEEGT